MDRQVGWRLVASLVAIVAIMIYLTGAVTMSSASTAGYASQYFLTQFAVAVFLGIPAAWCGKSYSPTDYLSSRYGTDSTIIWGWVTGLAVFTITALFGATWSILAIPAATTVGSITYIVIEDGQTDKYLPVNYWMSVLAATGVVIWAWSAGCAVESWTLAGLVMFCAHYFWQVTSRNRGTNR